MIPPDWLPHRRPADDELVGYLVPHGNAFVPVTLFGCPLADPSDRIEAGRLLDASGLSVLAEPWRLDVSGDERVRVAIRGVSPERMIVVADDFGYGGSLSEAMVLDVPEAGRLSRRR